MIVNEADIKSLSAGPSDILILSDRQDRIKQQSLMQEILEYHLSLGVRNILSKQSSALQTEIETSQILIDMPDSFFEFPLATILRPHMLGTEAEKSLTRFEDTIFSIDDLQKLRRHAVAYLDQLKGGQSILDEVLVTIIEAATNSTLHGPSEHVKLNLGPNCPRPHARVKMGVEGDRFVVLCEDKFGSMSLPEIIGGARACFRSGIHRLERKNESAGIGVAMMMDYCSSFFMGVKKSKQSVVACSFLLNTSREKRTSYGKCIHLVM